MSKKYRIIRFFIDKNKKSTVIKKNISFSEAEEHCNRSDTHGDGWFDGYSAE